MKKLLLLAGFLVATTSVFAQGMVSFANTSTTLIRTNDLTSGLAGNISGAAGAFHIELLVAPQGTSVAPDGALGPWSIIASATNSPSLAGRFFGGTVTNTLTSAGGPMAVMVRAWLSRGGEGSYDAAPNSRGQSGILQLAGSGNPNPPATPASAIFGAGLLQGFDVVVQPVPEPSSIALGLLGLGALALIRRRK